MDAATRQRVQREGWRQKRERADREEAATPPEDRSWRAEAACAGQDPADWVFDNEDQKGARVKIAAAKLTCQACPSLLPCLNYALAQRSDTVGVWAGTTARDRQRIRRRRNLGG